MAVASLTLVLMHGADDLAAQQFAQEGMGVAGKAAGFIQPVDDEGGMLQLDQRRAGFDLRERGRPTAVGTTGTTTSAAWGISRLRKATSPKATSAMT
jgi:hypothetical protein